MTGIAHKEFVLAGQTANSTYYCEVLPFSPGNFWPKTNMTVIPHLPYGSLFPRLKIKLKGRHFGRIAGSTEHPHKTRFPR
jgi:hypothetical protein